MKWNHCGLWIALLLGGFGLTACGSESYMQQAQQTELSEEESTQVQESADCYVQVDGAVHQPGVYALPMDARVRDAIELAGGLTEEAYAKDLNQARVIEDGEKIYVSTVDEMLLESSTDDGRVNINTAGVEELTTLTGIGETRAQTIIDYRESNGLFSAPEDIMNVSGIGESTYAKIANAIKVN